MGAPVSHTCPTIDSVIETVATSKKSIDRLLEDFEYTTIQDLKTQLRDISNALDGLYGSPRSEMEEIRTANEKLREWGYDSEEKISELEGEVYDLKAELRALEAA